MKTPKRTINLADLISNIEDCGNTIAILTVAHDGIVSLYGPGDVEFVDPELYEREVGAYKVEHIDDDYVCVEISLW